MANSSYEREGRDGSAQHDPTGRRSNEIRRATERAPTNTTRSTLAEDRIFGRRAGFIGFSILAHLALLLGIMLNSNLIPAIRELGGGDGQAAGVGSGSSASESDISIVEVTDLESSVSPSSPENTTAAAAVSSESDVVVAKTPKTAPAQVQPSAPKAITPPKAAIVEQMPETQAQVAPVQETPAQVVPSEEVPTEETSAAEEAPPTLLAAPPEEQPSSDQPVVEKAEQQEPLAQAVAEPEPQPPFESSVATQSQAEAADTTDSESADTTATATASTESPRGETAPPQSAAGESTGGNGGPSETETAGAGENQNQGPGAGVVINGPIRDAGELRALPGKPNPIYPARDRLKRKEGTAVVLGQVSADGRVSRVVLEKSSGSKEMDLESAKAFKNWRFQSGQAGWVRKPFQFRLVGQAKEVPAPLGEVLKRKSGALGK